MSNIPIPQPEKGSQTPEHDDSSDDGVFAVDSGGSVSLDPLPVSPEETMGEDDIASEDANSD